MELNYDNILSEIKKMVKKFFRKDRPVGLAISFFDTSVGAYWVSGGNYIMLNGNVISAMDAYGKAKNEKEALVKVLLAHEYIHSLGNFDEIGTRDITNKIFSQEYGENSLEYKIASEGPWEVYPFIGSYPGLVSEKIEVIKNFDSDSTNYII